MLPVVDQHLYLLFLKIITLHVLMLEIQGPFLPDKVHLLKFSVKEKLGDDIPLSRSKTMC